jgi:hypothetical protein
MARPPDLEALRRFVWVRLPRAVVLERDRWDPASGTVELVLSGPGGTRAVSLDLRRWQTGDRAGIEADVLSAARAVAAPGPAP